MDRLSRVFGTIFALVGILGGVYGFHIKDTGQQIAALLYGGGALGVTFAGDYLTLFLCWELMAVGSVCLVWARRTPQAEAAGIRYLLVHLFGGSLLLAGIVLQVNASGSLAVVPFADGESLAAWFNKMGMLYDSIHQLEYEGQAGEIHEREEHAGRLAGT